MHHQWTYKITKQSAHAMTNWCFIISGERGGGGGGWGGGGRGGGGGGGGGVEVEVALLTHQKLNKFKTVQAITVQNF